MIVVIDYGLGNITSVSRALMKKSADVLVSREAKDIKSANGVILPGVGAFKKAMENLNELQLIQPIIEYISSGKPYLGICLGLQILFSESYEHAGKEGPVQGFNIFKGSVIKFEPRIKIPHMGWNEVITREPGSKIFNGIKNCSFFYFDHSYYVKPEDKEIIAGETDYGTDELGEKTYSHSHTDIYFTSAIVKGNIWGVQFHPEKSSSMGLQLLNNFLEIC